MNLSRNRNDNKEPAKRRSEERVFQTEGTAFLKALKVHQIGTRGQHSSVKSHIVNTLGFVGCLVSVTTIQLCNFKLKWPQALCKQMGMVMLQ